MATRNPLRPWLAILALAAALAAGCGPGIGGTGTGTAAVPPADLSLKPVCESSFADLLRCNGLPGTAASALGTGLSFLADSATARNALLRLEGNAADLELFCAGLQFSGNWGQVPGQVPRYHGLLRGLTGADSIYASLAVVRSGSTLQVQLYDADGRALSGAYTLQLVPAAPAVVRSCT